jgi:imidazoleglycerol phosphate synthase glutamine amidotransferase subunit HisH
MSPDKLEKYILDHRESFDDLEPDPSVWERIDTRKAPVIRINWKDIAWKAAAVAVIFVASYFFHDYMASRNQPDQMLAGKSGEEASPMVRELAEAEAYYSAQINLKKDELYRLAGSNPELRREVDLELVDLDQVYNELKDDLKDNAANEEVIEAMIQNYRLKLDILEEMLMLLNQSNESQNEKDHEGAVEL